MKVNDVCVRNAKSCGPDTTLAAAGWLMWENDCGVVPVVDAQGKVVGVITDRDICMATVTKNRPATDIKVGEVISGQVHACAANDDVAQALKVMRTNQVRRLPVVDARGVLQGVLSMNDLVLRARENKGTKPVDLAYEDVMLALKAICTHRAESKERAPQRHLAAAKG